MPHNNIITNGYHVGDKIQVNYNINKMFGEIVSISPIFLKIKNRNNSIITIRQSSIDSIQILEDNEIADNNEKLSYNKKSPMSTNQIVDSFDALLANVFPILSISNKTLIPTNATVTEINDSGIGGRTRDDQLGLAFLGKLHDLVVVDSVSHAVNAVGYKVEVLTRNIDG